MHLPETALHTGGFRSLGGDQGVLVGRYQWPFAKDNAQVLSELGFNLLEFRVVPAACTALKVGKFFQGHRGRGVATDVRWFGALWLSARTAGVCIRVCVRVRVRRLSRRSHKYPRAHHGRDKNDHDNQELQKTFHQNSSEQMSEKLGIAQSGPAL